MPETFDSQPTASNPPTANRNTRADLPQLLKQYAAAALGVAGVSVAAAQAPAPQMVQASTNLVAGGHNIIYTPANITINTGAHRSTFIPIDLNHDGITDFGLVASHFTDFFSGGLGFAGYGRIRIDGSSVGNMVIASHALPKGEIIDKGGVFKSGAQTLAYATTGSYKGVQHSGGRGAFVKVTNKYLGVRFQIKGEMHEGWIRFTLTWKGDDITGAITGYAFDTVPNQTGLAAGQIGGTVGGAVAKEAVNGADSVSVGVGSLGMLAAGSSAIPLWRQTFGEPASN